MRNSVRQSPCLRVKEYSLEIGIISPLTPMIPIISRRRGRTEPCGRYWRDGPRKIALYTCYTTCFDLGDLHSQTGCNDSPLSLLGQRLSNSSRSYRST